MVWNSNFTHKSSLKCTCRSCRPVSHHAKSSVFPIWALSSFLDDSIECFKAKTPIASRWAIAPCIQSYVGAEVMLWPFQAAQKGRACGPSQISDNGRIQSPAFFQKKISCHSYTSSAFEHRRETKCSARSWHRVSVTMTTPSVAFNSASNSALEMSNSSIIVSISEKNEKM